MRYYLRRIRLNRGGYDDMGSYWGIGMPLYECEADCGHDRRIYRTLRAATRSAAKLWVKANVDLDATFFN